MKMVAILICLIGCLTLYCSHHHQTLLKQHLSKSYRVIGVFMLIISLILLLFSVPKLVALYMWLMTMLVVWSLVPFIRLFKKNIPDEISRSTKNPT